MDNSCDREASEGSNIDGRRGLSWHEGADHGTASNGATTNGCGEDPSKNLLLLVAFGKQTTETCQYDYDKGSQKEQCLFWGVLI